MNQKTQNGGTRLTSIRSWREASRKVAGGARLKYITQSSGKSAPILEGQYPRGPEESPLFNHLNL